MGKGTDRLEEAGPADTSFSCTLSLLHSWLQSHRLQSLTKHTASLVFIPGNLAFYCNLKPKEERTESKTQKNKILNCIQVKCSPSACTLDHINHLRKGGHFRSLLFKISLPVRVSTLASGRWGEMKAPGSPERQWLRQAVTKGSKGLPAGPRPCTQGDRP